MEPYYEDGSVTIYHADCREVVDEIEPGVVVTDPPYGLGISYDSAAASDTPDAVAALVQDVVVGLVERTPIVMVTPGLSNMWAYPRPTAVGCWYVPGNPGRGFPWSHPEWEPVLVYTQRLLGGSSVFRVPMGKQLDTGDHPCPKPLALMRALVGRAVTGSGDAKPLVLDPFMGSGSTIVAAKWLGVPSVGIEQSERYCEIAAKRCAQEVLDFGA